jgi:uncharacterized membrane protein YgcG
VEAAVPAGEDARSDSGLTIAQRDRVERARVQAEEQTGLRFSIYVAAVTGAITETARRLLASVEPDPASAVLVVVDPGARLLEIVTGSVAARHLADRDAALTAVSMTTSFANGDLVEGIVDGLRTLADHARSPRTLHTDTP